MRAELRAGGDAFGSMTVGTMDQRTFSPPELVFVAAAADQVAIEVERSRQLSSGEAPLAPDGPTAT